ncbi:MAG: MFS transporter [Chloroflexi bacterium]|nr:MFS transporter [Chloroflexota bacterium]
MRLLPHPLLLAFGAFGCVWGAWQAVLPDLAAHYELSSGPLGLMLTAGFAVSLPVMIGAGRLIDRVGSQVGIALTSLMLGAGLATVAMLGPLPALVGGVILLAAGSGAFDVAINGAAMGDETWGRPARLTLLHAAFSGGGLIGAVSAGAVIGAGIAFQVVYPVLAVVLIGSAVMSLTGHRRPVVREGAVPRALALALLPLAVLAGLAFLAEGSLETWSAIYLRDALGAAAFVGALGPGAFHAAMLVGRLIGAGVAGSLGAGATLLASGSMIVAGMVVALTVTSVPLAIASMFAAALGAAFMVPVVISLAGQRAGRHAGRAASYVLSLGYAGFLLGPSAVGIIGEAAGLRAGLAVIPVAAALVVVLSRTRLVRG